MYPPHSSEVHVLIQVRFTENEGETIGLTETRFHYINDAALKHAALVLGDTLCADDFNISEFISLNS